MFVCLFVWGLSSHSRIFDSYGGVENFECPIRILEMMHLYCFRDLRVNWFTNFVLNTIKVYFYSVSRTELLHSFAWYFKNLLLDSFKTLNGRYLCQVLALIFSGFSLALKTFLYEWRKAIINQSLNSAFHTSVLEFSVPVIRITAFPMKSFLIKFFMILHHAIYAIFNSTQLLRSQSEIECMFWKSALYF